MAKLRLLIGTAGSGKTHAVLDEAARLAAESPLPTPGHPPVLVIVPEQQAVQILNRLKDLIPYMPNLYMGILASMVVPFPGDDWIDRVPPSLATRSCREAPWTSRWYRLRSSRS